MSHQTDRDTLDRLLGAVRRRIFLKSALFHLVRASLVVLPCVAVAIAANQRWGDASWNWVPVAGAILLLGLFAVVRGFRELGDRTRSALAVDEQAHLKDRITSAYEFLGEGELDEPRAIQVRDAVAHAKALDSQALFRFQWPRYSLCLPVVLILFALSFLVPPAVVPTQAAASEDPTKALQLQELKALEEQLLAKEEQPTDELKELMEKLKEIRQQFEQGKLAERDLMIELARLDEALQQKTAELGAEQLDGELNMIVPHLMSSSAAMEVAKAIQENELDQAAQELQKLAAKVKEKEISEEARKELAMNMGVAAAKLGSKKNNSFGGNFAQASEALEKEDGEEFESACESMGDKLRLVKKARAMKMASKKIGICKACLGQCDSKIGGYQLGEKSQGKNKGGLRAGTAASGDPFGERSRLEASYRNVLRVTGQAGEGPVETETEVTEGQLSQSQIGLKELHASYEAVAEEAIENETIPLSHRFHVKRYFQTIRPKD